MNSEVFCWELAEVIFCPFVISSLFFFFFTKCLSLFISQLGKTKVFLRAGQIGVLDSQRAEVLDFAAKRIQGRLQTFITRRVFITNRTAAISLQTYCRGSAQLLSCISCYLCWEIPIMQIIFVSSFLSTMISISFFFWQQKLKVYMKQAWKLTIMVVALLYLTVFVLISK